jgi:hypothetical protein
MRLDVTWGAKEAELDGDAVAVERAVGLTHMDLEDAPVPPDMAVRAQYGGTGKGASGPGVALVLEIAEHVVNDVGSLIGIGYALRTLISWVSQRRGAEPACASAEALAALAAASSPILSENPEAWYHTRTVPLTTDGGIGTDMRDVWVSAFVNEQAGVVQLVFSSSTTRYLGHAAVATEWYYGDGVGRVRSDDELADQLRAWFTP